MIHKRPFVDKDSYEVASKQHRLLEHACQLSPAIDTVPSNRQIDGEGEEDGLIKFQDEGRLVNDLVTEVSNERKVLETSVSGSIPKILWVNESIIGADVRSETAAHFSFFPEFFQSGDQLKPLYQSEEIYLSLLNGAPRKLVSVGPEHQAFVPEWGVQQLKNSPDNLEEPNPQLAISRASNGGLLVDDVNEEMLMGTCVIPMPDPEASANLCYESGETRCDCTCLDEGSVRCVRQHVKEARGKLKENFGQEIFEELGFGEMGEEVAKRWTLEEEQAFHEVVLSNPASLGKNFWDHLLAVFPSRMKKDLVNYYFNIFMLQKRAEQNRFDPLNIDSDNDEWQKSEPGLLEEDEDSVVESPFDQDASAYYQENHVEDCPEEIEVEEEVDAGKHGADIIIHRVGTDEEDGGDIDDISGTRISNSFDDCRGDNQLEVYGKIPSYNSEDYDIQEDSCTSFESQRDKIDSCGPADDARESSGE